ncbi:amino acid adenylation domain-containing protein [Streptomyces sp. NPDC059679]|uniref:amino acid adenylation domain-containing protein n=1 Tax=Streptomyces sp. NPDC059679 TaxID=3346903 RepID=UPI00368FAAC0
MERHDALDPNTLSPAKRTLLDRLRRGQLQDEPKIPRLDSDGPFRLSYAQERVWFAEQLAPELGAFNLVTAAMLRGTLEAAEVEQRLAAIVSRHDALRMSIHVDTDGPRARIADTVPVHVPVLDLSAAEVPGGGLDEMARQAAVAIGRRGYDLARAPLWRVELVRLPQNRTLVVAAAHHVILDGPSFQLLGFEIVGEGAAPDLPVRFADFADWQRRQVEGGAFAAEQEYWRRQLSELPGPPELPADRPRTARPTFRGATLSAPVPPRTLQRISAVSKEAGVTPYLTLLAAFTALLHRWTGDHDVVVGSSVSGRTRPEVQHLLGTFNNLIVLRTRLEGHPSFRELLRRVTEVATEGFDHQDLPYEWLVRELAGSAGGLVSVCFNMPVQETAVDMLDLPAIPQGSQFDLTAHVMRLADDGMRIQFEYSADLFDEDTARALLDQYLGLTDALLADPDRPVAEAPMAAPAIEAVGPAAEGSLTGRVLAQAAATPAATAVVSDEGALTYAQLVSRAQAIAAGLRARGVRRGTPVGVRLPRGPALPAAVLGVWLAGGVYVPLDPEHPEARIQLIVAETGAVVLGGPLPAEDTAIAPAETKAICEPDPMDPAYIVYTSGSTGRPKGAVVTHGGIANRVQWAVSRHAFGPDDRMLHKTRISFDAHVWELFAPLVSGGAVVMAPPGAEADPETMLRAVADHGVSVLQVVPSVLSLLADASSARWRDCARLRLLFSAGEPLHAELCRRVRAHAPGLAIVNTYGPTECAIDVTAHLVDVDRAAGPIPIGRPIDGVRLLVLDREGRPVPPLVPGELYVGGPAVGLGYLGRSALTAAAFVPDPAGGGRRLYRTGDRVRLRRDGVLEFLGRLDQQVKVSGVRVEPGEVEAVLARHPGVVLAAVVVREGSLVACFTGDASHDELRSFLGERLPATMAPTRFVTLERLPLNSSGKVDRASLPGAKAGAGPAVPAVPAAPRNAVEAAIAAQWSELLGRDTVGIHDDFFTLGGHSLLLTRLGMRLREAFNAEIPLRDLLSATTVERQAALVGSARRGGSAIPSARREGPLPLSPSQRRLWFLDRLDPGSTRYTVPLVLRLRGDIAPERLAQALSEIVRRHEVLRTRYCLPEEPEPVQIVMPARPVTLHRTEGPLSAVLEREIGRPFDLAAGEVLRTLLVGQADGDDVLVLLLHHIACDGWSLEILTRELGALSTGTVPPPPAIQYGDFAAWQARDARDDEDRLLSYWRGRLAGLSPLELPTDRPRPSEFSGRGAVAGFVITERTANALRALGRAQGATPFMSLLTPFLALLFRYTGTADAAVGTPLAGREQPETRDVIGFFANTLVLRTDLSADPSFAELLDRVRATVLEAYAHQGLPFERLVEELDPQRDLSRNPLFQVMFEMSTAQGPGSLDFGGAVTAERLVQIPWHTAAFDVTMSLAEQSDGSILGYVEYATDLFDASTMRRFVDRYQLVAEAMAADPGLRLSAVDFFTETERQLIAAPAALTAPPECLHDAFRRQAARTPDAPALITMTGDRLSYAELDARSDGVAHALRHAGVTAETPVAVVLGRGADAVVAMLGVLKAGGVHTPLDPDAPTGRLADHGARYAVTTPGLAGLVAPYVARVLTVDTEDASVAPSHPPEAGVTPRHLAYTIFTSGSTGKPKGVMVEHGSWTGHLRELNRSYGIGPGDRVLLMSSVGFDQTMETVGIALLTGATLVVADQELTSPERMPGLLARHGVTFAETTPAYYREMVPHCDERLAGLRLLAVGADVLHYDDVAAWQAVGSPARFVSGYGPTEATVTCTVETVSLAAPATHAGAERVPIGRAIGPTRLHVLDAQLNEVPFGVPGELYIGGPRLARGYVGRPDLTADRFVPDPFGTGERLYRTGDLVRYREDGSLCFLERIDQQVKVRGFRIETGEVEAALLGCPGVGQAVVHAVADGRERELVGYVVPAGEGLGPGELQESLAARLPGYMIPTRWTVLDRLPMTSSGKVDRQALNRMVPQTRREPMRQPQTPAERRIAEIWADVLETDVGTVGVDQNFFDHGGHSLRATRVHTRLRETFGIDLPLRRLFEAVTVGELAREVEAAIAAEIASLSDEEAAAQLEKEWG